jgi:NifU-like protein involved in Fe-S cluster formation
MKIYCVLIHIKNVGVLVDEVRQQLLAAMGFSHKAIAILEKNLNMYTMQNPSITEEHQGSCGDILFLSLKIQSEYIKDASYEYIGCAGLQACASALTEMIKGKKLVEAIKYEVKDIIDYLEGIPKQKYECAEISRDTLRKAVDRWLIKSKN